MSYFGSLIVEVGAGVVSKKIVKSKSIARFTAALIANIKPKEVFER